MTTMIGTLGSFLCLVALCFTLFSEGFGNSLYYKLLNLMGGICLLIYSIALYAIPFIILESVWILSSLIGTINQFKKINNYKKT